MTEDTKVILLLCAYLGKDNECKPLTQTEYTKLTKWLVSVNKRPCDLLDDKITIEAASNTGIDISRLKFLLNRGFKLSLSVEEWNSNNIWVISRSDKEYPRRFKEHLKHKSPPLLFGCGDMNLLQGGGVSIVGSRNIDSIAETYTVNAARQCVQNELTVVSGGARGVDKIAMTTALKYGGYSIGVVAENLLKNSVSRDYRNFIASGRLLLLSPFHPNSRFSVGNAMSRNKLVYSMADFALIINSEHNKGGTWAGAKEELERLNHRPVFVRMDEHEAIGNRKLLELGASVWPISETKHLRQKLIDSSSNNKFTNEIGGYSIPELFNFKD